MKICKICKGNVITRNFNNTHDLWWCDIYGIVSEVEDSTEMDIKEDVIDEYSKKYNRTSVTF